MLLKPLVFNIYCEKDKENLKFKKGLRQNNWRSKNEVMNPCR
jgi:hypothetical protein